MLCTFFLYSDSKEERPADNNVDISIPVQYDAGIILSRWFHYLLDNFSHFSHAV